MTTLKFPAEWHAQHAVLLTWPHKNSDWQAALEEADAFYLKLSKLILEYQNLILVVDSIEHQSQIEAHLCEASPPHQWSSYVIPSNDTWSRDHGPISVYRNGQLTMLDFQFNGWGSKYPADLDNAITESLVRHNAFPESDYQQVACVLEGGGIETDGEGTLLTTTSCLLNPNRNPGMNKADIEQVLASELGVSRFLWLNHGRLSGDDTDGHIDTLARFCDSSSIAYIKCNDEQDEHFQSLHAMEQELKGFRQANGSPYRLIPLPLPKVFSKAGRRLAATYANFLILNGAILLPIYQVAEDEAAISALAATFPDRNIIPVDCRILIQQNGSLHCITMQIPAEAYKIHEINQ